MIAPMRKSEGRNHAPTFFNEASFIEQILYNYTSYSHIVRWTIDEREVDLDQSLTINLTTDETCTSITWTVNDIYIPNPLGLGLNGNAVSSR